MVTERCMTSNNRNRSQWTGKTAIVDTASVFTQTCGGGQKSVPCDKPRETNQERMVIVTFAYMVCICVLAPFYCLHTACIDSIRSHIRAHLNVLFPIIIFICQFHWPIFYDGQTNQPQFQQHTLDAILFYVSILLLHMRYWISWHIWSGSYSSEKNMLPMGFRYLIWTQWIESTQIDRTGKQLMNKMYIKGLALCLCLHGRLVNG